MGVRRTVLAAGGLIVAGLIGALAIVGCAAHAGTAQLAATRSGTAQLAAARSGTAQQGSAQSGSVRTCAAYAYQAIQRHEVVTGLPAACEGLSRAQLRDRFDKQRAAIVKFATETQIPLKEHTHHG